MRFEFDRAKAASNVKKHGVSFAVLRGAVIRLISARRATKREVKSYAS